MGEGPKDAIVLGTIKAGIKSFNKISKIANIVPKELEQVLETLESRKLIEVNEKKGFLGIKIEIKITEKGGKNLDNQVNELKGKWNQMTQLYKLEDKPELQKYMGENKISFKQMIFFGILDKELFSMMSSMVGMTMTEFISPQDTPQDVDGEGGMERGQGN
jgi:DNA-binding HxlR family transcriptional regulator